MFEIYKNPPENCRALFDAFGSFNRIAFRLRWDKLRLQGEPPEIKIFEESGLWSDDLKGGETKDRSKM